jgi:hypothetical protein
MVQAYIAGIGDLEAAAHTAMRLRGSSGSSFDADLLKSNEKARLYAHPTYAV